MLRPPAQVERAPCDADALAARKERAAPLVRDRPESAARLYRELLRQARASPAQPRGPLRRRDFASHVFSLAVAYCSSLSLDELLRGKQF